MSRRERFGREEEEGKETLGGFLFFFFSWCYLYYSILFFIFFLVIWRVTSFDELQLFIHFDIIFVDFLFFTTRPKTPMGEW